MEITLAGRNKIYRLTVIGLSAEPRFSTIVRRVMHVWWTGRDKCAAIGRWKIKNSSLPPYPSRVHIFSSLSLSFISFWVTDAYFAIITIDAILRFVYTSIGIRTGHFPVPFATSVAIAFAYKRTITYELRLFLPPDRMVNFNEKIPPHPTQMLIQLDAFFLFVSWRRDKSIVIKRRF